MLSGKRSKGERRRSPLSHFPNLMPILLIPPGYPGLKFNVTYFFSLGIRSGIAIRYSISYAQSKLLVKIIFPNNCIYWWFVR